MNLNSNKERETYWSFINKEYSREELEKAFSTLKQDMLKVVLLRQQDKYSFQQIATIMNRSITVVRNHHGRGIYKLYRYFNPRVVETS